MSDVDEERARATGAVVVPADGALETECDVYAPCALGATLNAESIPRLRCRVVAGACEQPARRRRTDAERLAAAGILYAPDYVINGGGALHGIGLEQLGWDEETLERKVAGIADTLRRVYDEAETEGITTAAAAERLAARNVSPRRRGRLQRLRPARWPGPAGRNARRARPMRLPSARDVDRLRPDRRVAEVVGRLDAHDVVAGLSCSCGRAVGSAVL